MRLPAARKVAVLLAEDDEQMFAGGEDVTIYIWRLKRERQRLDEVAALTAHDGHAGASLAQGKGTLYSGSADVRIRAWDHETLGCICSFLGHASTVTALLCWDWFLPSSSENGTVKKTAGRGRRRAGMGPIGRVGPGWSRRLVGRGPTALSLLSRTSSSRKTKAPGDTENRHSRLRGGETPRKELSGGQESGWEIPSGGEIDAIATVIELEIIGIIIIIIFTIYTAISTAASRHRCNI
ncbi:hypothetical protein QYE76_068993 [Lolium multiflorum]|uniref:Uncharacterized protein n=1 Tax=Lolium multiflorum TaxID=4521 RepID=A0AAD8SGJ3_LOLMU|nr:hypothetical protein QYE76_068993 [Lolium multiflorum]